MVWGTLRHTPPPRDVSGTFPKENIQVKQCPVRNDNTAESNNLSYISDDASFVDSGRSIGLQTDGATSDLDLTTDEYELETGESRDILPIGPPTDGAASTTDKYELETCDSRHRILEESRGCDVLCDNFFCKIDRMDNKEFETFRLEEAETFINDSINKSYYDPERGYVSGEFGNQIVRQGDGDSVEVGWNTVKRGRRSPLCIEPVAATPTTPSPPPQALPSPPPPQRRSYVTLIEKLFTPML